MLSMYAHYSVDRKRHRFIDYFSVYKLLTASLFLLLLVDSTFWLVIIPCYVLFNYLGANSKAFWLKTKDSEPALGSYYGAGWLVFSMVLLVSGVCLFCFIVFKALLFDMIINFLTEDPYYQVVSGYGVDYFFWMLYFFSTHFIVSAGNYYSFHSESEKKNASGLMDRIDDFKLKYGLRVE